MQKSQNLSISGDLPLSVRILPNQRPLWLGLFAGLALCVVMPLAPLWLGQPLVHSSALGRLAVAAGAAVTLVCAWRLAVQLPVIEASEFGVAVWFHGPYRSPFFVPWRNVRAVVVTRARPPGSGAARPARKALGIELACEGGLRLPEAAARAEIAVDGPAPAHLVWSHRIIGGNLRRTAALLQRMQAAYGCASRADG